MSLSIAMLYQYFNLGTQLKSFNNYNLTIIILFNISYSFKQLNGSTYCYVSQTIQFSISHLFTHS